KHESSSPGVSFTENKLRGREGPLLIVPDRYRGFCSEVGAKICELSRQSATAARSACSCARLKPGAKFGSLACGGRMAYASSTHSSHHAHVACCVFPQVSTVTPFWS